MKDDKSNPYSYAIVFQFLIAILNLPIAIWYGFQLPSLTGNLLFFILAAALWGGAIVFLFTALKFIEASEVTILSSARVLITILASIIFLQETFNVQKILGTIIILLAILLVANIKNGIKFNKGILYIFATTLFSGLAIVVDSFNVQHYDVISYVTIANFLIVIILLLFYPKAIQQWRHFTKPNFLKKMLPLVIFSLIQGLAYLFALSYGGNTAQVGTIRQASVIVTVILAVIFLGEKDNLFRKLIAAVLVTFGVILLS